MRSSGGTSGWISAIARLAAAAEQRVDELRYRRRGARAGDGVRIVAYRGTGTPTALGVRGRVLRNPPLPPGAAEHSAWENLLATVKRFETDEVPHARILARHEGVEQIITANEEGFFDARLHTREPVMRTQTWHEVELELLEPAPTDGPVRVAAPVLVPTLGAAFGVISDIDDTVVKTNATDMLRMAREVFFGNAHTRLPFEGVSAFYRALRAGPLGTGENPLFYVSSSPWNLYDLLEEFFALHDIPPGPILLRDWGLTSKELLPTSHGPHKGAAIRELLATYPELPFVLIGDSGQEDPEIYADVMREFPGRIRAAYIRNVSVAEQRVSAIRSLARELAETDATLLLADDTISAARHAANEGWIDPASLPSIGTAAAEGK
jgi:phosphatidate phosphatase APP1